MIVAIWNRRVQATQLFQIHVVTLLPPLPQQQLNRNHPPLLQRQLRQNHPQIPQHRLRQNHPPILRQQHHQKHRPPHRHRKKKLRIHLRSHLWNLRFWGPRRVKKQRIIRRVRRRKIAYILRGPENTLQVPHPIFLPIFDPGVINNALKSTSSAGKTNKVQNNTTTSFQRHKLRLFTHVIRIKISSVACMIEYDRIQEEPTT